MQSYPRTKFYWCWTTLWNSIFYHTQGRPKERRREIAKVWLDTPEHQFQVYFKVYIIGTHEQTDIYFLQTKVVKNTPEGSICFQSEPLYFSEYATVTYDIISRENWILASRQDVVHINPGDTFYAEYKISLSVESKPLYTGKSIFEEDFGGQITN